MHQLFVGVIWEQEACGRRWGFLEFVGIFRRSGVMTLSGFREVRGSVSAGEGG
jgi:hypothetical protein